MINLTFTVDNLTTVVQVFDRIQIRRYAGAITPPTSPVTDLVAFSDYTTVSGYDTISSVTGASEVILHSDISQYYFTDYDGEAYDWYISRYYSTSDGATSGWADPILGEPGDLYYDPVYPPEIEYGSEDQRIIDRIRLYIGDPIGLRREYGDDALSSIHTDGRTYELDEKGWPCYITMGGKSYTNTANPSINGYKFLRFDEFIDDTCITCSGVTNVCGEDVTREVVNGVDIWYYTFRNSDRQIMEAYDSCPPPPGLTTTTATSEAYILQTSIDILYKELWEDATEDGAAIKDEGSVYNPEPGLKIREEMLDKLKKKLDDLISATILSGITGVRVD